MEKMRQIIVCFLFAFVLFACSDGKCSVEGTIADAAGDTLYIERMEVQKISVLDSLKLPTSGNFRFSLPCPEYPDFYRLRLNGQYIVFAIDSCEMLKVLSHKKTFSTDYIIENSVDNEHIRQLRLSNFAIQKLVNNTQNRPTSEFLQGKIESHKQMARKIILSDTKSAAAYFAVNQMINGYYFFSPYDVEDGAYWAAVATAYKVNYPNYDRTKMLENTVLSVMKHKRDKANAIDYEKLLQTEAVGCVDIELTDNKGRKVSLSSQKGTVVLLDFSLIDVANSSARILALRELYNRFAKQNFTVFQVSFDADYAAWMDKTKLLPWICVNDKRAAQSDYILIFNLKSLPTYFLLNWDGDIVERLETLDGIESKIEALL